MDIDFVDIKIIGLDEDRTVPSPVRPNLHYVYLQLTQTPPPLWQTHFTDSRKVSRHPHWRQAWIDRKYIVVECLLPEMERHHLNDLRQDIAYANRHYRKYLETHVDPDNQKALADQQARDYLRQMKGRLTFD